MISDDRIASVVRCRRIFGFGFIHCAEVMVSEHVDWQAAISHFFAGVRNDVGGARISVVLALASTVVRVVDGLPLSSDTTALREIIASSPFRYVPRRFATMISEVEPCGDGGVLVAFVGLDIVLSIVKACGEAGLHLHEIAIAKDAISISRNVSANPASSFEDILSDALNLPKRDWISTVGTGMSMWRPRAFTIVAIGLLLVVTAFAPAWRLMVAHRQAQGSTPKATYVDAALRRRTQLDSLRMPLERARSAASRSIHPLIVLDKLGMALGSNGRILSFEADSMRVQATVVAPSLVPFLRRLERNSDVRDVAVIGGISHDSANDTMMERALVSFRYIAHSLMAPDVEHNR